MTEDNVLLERERIKEIIERKINAVIDWRDKNIKSNRKVLYIFERLKRDVFFLIDTPEYVRVKDRQ